MASAIRVRLSKSWLPEKKYIVSRLLEFLIKDPQIHFDIPEKPTQRVEIDLSGQSGKIIFSSDFFSLDETQPLRIPNFNLEDFNQTFRWEGDNCRIISDILGISFILMTQLEDFYSTKKDAHSRLPFHERFLGRYGLEKRPIVEEYLELLRLAVRRLWPQVPLRRTDYELHLSHDIDRPWAHKNVSGRRFARGLARDLIDFRDFGLVPKYFRSYFFSEKDPYWTFDELMTFEESIGLRGHYYFIPRSRNSRFDSNYSLDDPAIAELMSEIHSRGHRLGIHPSYLSSENPAFLSEEFEIFKKKCRELGIPAEGVEGRQHYLKWNPQRSWKDWSELGAARDLSLGFPEKPGFRTGLCRPYSVFDLQSRKELPFEELPLLIMDAHSPPYDSIMEIANSCRRYGGVCTILIHNNRISSQRERSFWFDLLRRIR